MRNKAPKIAHTTGQSSMKHCEGGGGGDDEVSNISGVMNWEDDMISVSLGASAGDLRVKRV